MRTVLRPFGRIFVSILLAVSTCAHADALLGPHVLSLRAVAALTLVPANASPLVAVLDTGFEVGHPALHSRLAGGYNVFTGGNDVGLKATDPFLYTHGTAIAGIISADPTLVVWPRSVYPNARILPIKVCCADASGQADSYALRQGILYAAGIRNDYGPASPERAAVINVSYVMSDLADPGLLDAIQQATRAGSVIVTALGEGTPQISPAMAGISGIIGVITAPATKTLPLLGEAMPVIPAPGSNITIIEPGGTVLAPIPSIGGATGSSFATAVTSAVAAMLIAANPNLSPADIATILTSDDVYDADGLDAVLAVQKADTLPLLPTQSGGGPTSSGGADAGGGSGGGALDAFTLALLSLAMLLGMIGRRQRG
jgi:serine protease